MTFFNKKTDVMNIELTPYGRYLLSIGKLKPKYYEFTDEDILYDNAAATGSAEAYQTQEEVHERIINETPRLKNVFPKKGIESDVIEALDDATDLDVKMDNLRHQVQSDTHNQKHVYAMGRSSYSSDKLPNFQLTMLTSKIKDSINYYKVEDGTHIRTLLDSLQIPQIDVELSVVATTGSEVVDPSENYDFTSQVFSDGRYVKLHFDEPIIHLKEFNSFYEKENFEIEVFDLDNRKLRNTQDVNDFIPLKFIIPKSLIQNEILMDGPDFDDSIPFSGQPQEELNATPDYCSYYFHIQVDDEIPIEDICKAVDNLEINSQFLDEELICPDIRTDRFNIYDSRVGPSDLEDCD